VFELTNKCCFLKVVFAIIAGYQKFVANKQKNKINKNKQVAIGTNLV
jgi:hypothetical protein